MDETYVLELEKYSGLPKELITKVLKDWTTKKGKSFDGFNQEDLREILVSMIQDLFVEVKEGQNPYIKLSD